MPQKAFHFDDEFSLLAEEQDGVLSRLQLTMLGWGHDHVEAEIAARRWAAYGEQALVLHRGPLTVRQQRWIAVLNGGPTATLAGLTAASEFGLTGFESPDVHIVVQADSWVPRRQAGVQVHVSRRFTVADRHPGRRLPTVTVERALVDAAAWTANGRRAAAILIAGVQQRLARPSDLRAELETAGQVRHRRLLRAVIDDVEGGVQALSELDFVHLCRRFKLPKPNHQVKRRDAGGRIRYLDVQFTRPDGRVLNVEIDGAGHVDLLRAWDDMRRDIDFLSRGEPTIRIPATVIRTNPAEVANRIRILLSAPR